MGARLLYRDSQGRDGAVELQPGAPCYVGRALDCAVRTDDAMVSRKHSLIRLEHGRFCVEDLGSSNGTHVNEVRVTKQALSHNDVVRCGSLWLRYVETPGDPRPAASAPATPPEVAATPRRTRAGYAGERAVEAAAPNAPMRRRQAQTAAEPLFGGPPAMPGGIVTGDLSTPSHAERAPVAADEPSVEINLEADARELERLRRQLDDAETALEELDAAHAREVAEARRLRAEIAGLNARGEEQRRAVVEQLEVSQASQRVADELRAELAAAERERRELRAEVVALRARAEGAERHATAAQDDAGRLRAAADRHGRQLADATHDDGQRWREADERQAEIARLRQVVAQQERLLEERRQGQVAQERLIKELRTAQKAAHDVFTRATVEKPPIDIDRTAIVSPSQNPATLIDRAVEAHERIDEALSEVRRAAVVAQQRLEAGGDEALAAARRAIEGVLGGAEEAKGALRGLKQVIESGDG